VVCQKGEGGLKNVLILVRIVPNGTQKEDMRGKKKKGKKQWEKGGRSKSFNMTDRASQTKERDVPHYPGISLNSGGWQAREEGKKRGREEDWGHSSCWGVDRCRELKKRSHDRRSRGSPCIRERKYKVRKRRNRERKAGPPGPHITAKDIQKGGGAHSIPLVQNSRTLQRREH